MASGGLTSEEKAASSRSSISKHELVTGDLPKPNNASSGTAASRFWKKFRAEKGNETQRGMKSRHLMMIGMSLLSVMSYKEPNLNPCSSHWRHHWYRNIFERGVGMWSRLKRALNTLYSSYLYAVIGYRVGWSWECTIVLFCCWVFRLYCGDYSVSYSSVFVCYLAYLSTLFAFRGEMSSMYPVSGAFSVFGARFVSPALGFTLGWNYWLQWYEDTWLLIEKCWLILLTCRSLSIRMDLLFFRQTHPKDFV